jgi:hypothetical protein
MAAPGASTKLLHASHVVRPLLLGPSAAPLSESNT